MDDREARRICESVEEADVWIELDLRHGRSTVSIKFDIDKPAPDAILTIIDTQTGTRKERPPMHAHGPTPSLVSWMITADRTADEDRRLSHLVALAESRADESSRIERIRARLMNRTVAPPVPGSALDCCAVA